MSEVNFKSLQAQHESLLQRQQGVTNENQQDFTKAVREFIDQAKQGGSYIASTRERDQVRANLRYWANYIYGIEGVFPDTELAPSTVTGSSSFWTSRIGLAALGLGLVLLIGLGSVLFRGTEVTATPTTTSTGSLSLTQQTSGTSTKEVTAPEDATPTATSIFDTVTLVALTSPENGANVLPKVQFTGVSANLKTEDSIHLLIVRGDSFFPIKEFVPQGELSPNGDWKLDAFLYTNAKELEQPENVIVVPAICFDQQCRDTLEASVETGLGGKNLPSQLSFRLYQDSSRVLYRNAYQAVQETRVVYSLSLNNASYDIYASQAEGTDILQITKTANISEIFPSLSPDGTKIAYVKRIEKTNSSPVMYAIAIMDSNGENDREITEWTRSVLENPQWSADSLYIAYAAGDISQSTSGASWNIHIYDLSTQSDAPVFVESERFDQRYFTWMPDANSIIYGARPQRTGTVGIDLISMDSSGESTPFFDTDKDDIQPSIRPFENGYLLTYTVVNQDKTHDIYAVINSKKQLPFDGSPIRLTFRRAGELVDGIVIGSTNSPIPDPASNSIYYIRNVNIYRLEFTLDAGRIELIDTIDRDGERYGTLVIETGQSDDILGFDVGYMEAFFPIFIIP